MVAIFFFEPAFKAPKRRPFNSRLDVSRLVALLGVLSKTFKPCRTPTDGHCRRIDVWGITHSFDFLKVSLSPLYIDSADITAFLMLFDICINVYQLTPSQLCLWENTLLL